MNDTRKYREQGRTGFVFSLMFLFIFIHASGWAYIIPSEQLLEFMVNNFSGINTMVIIQATIQETSDQDQRPPQQFKEQLWLRSPGSFESRVLDQDQPRPGPLDLSYRRLIMAGTRSGLELYLQGLGIELDQAALTRLEGTIAFQIGAPAPASPKLLIEKERFLPLLITYRSRHRPGKMVEVRFTDYRKLERGWYPFKIIYSIDQEMKESSTIQSYEVNVPVNPALFERKSESPVPPAKEQSGSRQTDQDRLKEIIRTFEEKYR